MNTHVNEGQVSKQRPVPLATWSLLLMCRPSGPNNAGFAFASGASQPRQFLCRPAGPGAENPDGDMANPDGENPMGTRHLHIASIT